MEALKLYYNTILSKVYFVATIVFFYILIYSYSIYNQAIGIDEIIKDHYLGSGNISLAGRWGEVVWTKLWDVLDYNPFVERFLSSFFYVVAAILADYIFFLISKVKKLWIHIFCVLSFISYPLINEIYVFGWTFFILAGSLCLCEIAIIIAYSNLSFILRLIFCSLLLTIPISSYESAIFFFISLACMCILLERIVLSDYHNTTNKKWNFVTLLVLSVLTSLVLRLFISWIINIIFRLDFVAGGATSIKWFTDSPLVVLAKIIGGNGLKYGLSALVYQPITVFLILSVIYFFIIFRHSLNKKDIILFVLAIIAYLSVFSQSFLQGTYMPYRTAQTTTIFVCFVVFLISIKAETQSNSYIKYMVFLFLSILCWSQSIHLNKLLVLNVQRYNNESFVMKEMGMRIKRDFDNKPVLFVKRYSMGQWILERVSVNPSTWNGKLYNEIVNFAVPDTFKKYLNNKYVESSIECVTDEYSALEDLFAYYGYDIKVIGPNAKPHTPEYLNPDYSLLNIAASVAKEKNIQPFEIIDNGDYLIVSLGSNQSFSPDN